MVDYGIDNYLRYFFSIYNPVFLALIFFLLLFVVIYLTYRHIYLPLLQRHRKEKESLELKNAKLMTLFSELDPNPIIKIGPTGLIVEMNKSAKENLNINLAIDDNIDKLLGDYQFNISELIRTDSSMVINGLFNNKEYEINIHGISLLGMAQLYLYDITEKKEHLEQMKAYQSLLRELSAKSLKDVENERSRIAGRLHDSVGQNLLLIKLGIQNLKKYLNGQSKEEYLNMINLLDSTINETKEISRRIRPLNLDELGLNTVLASLCKTVAKEGHLNYQLNLLDDKIKLDKDLELCIYRVVQEALNNIINHARATSFAVNLHTENDSIQLGISDDGIGFIPSILLNDKYISKGLGIVNMQERIEKLKGDFRIDSTPLKGTLIFADFPMMKKENGE